MAIQIWQPGAKIKNERFHILKQMGEGGFGITYLAEDTVKKQQVVIKTLNASQQSKVDFVQKQGNFVNEGFILKAFNHPHIVKVHEMIQVENLSGLVMEYIPGQDLADYIIANGRLGEAEALNYIDQIAQALDCVHQQKFFHRDVKPHNIMLRQDRGEAVLIDFGIAKEFVDLETIYLSNSLGTELYKPIEQYEKRGQFGAYTDIYALAVTLYHLLTGAAPGGGSPLYTSKARKDAQDNGGGEQIEKYLWGKLAEIGISDRTQSAIKAGMEIDPSQRPQNMIEFRELLGLGKEKDTELEYDVETFLEHGEKLLDSGKFEAALRIFELAIEFEPSSIMWSLHGYTLNKLGKDEEAIFSFDCALNFEINDPIDWQNRGNSLHNLGRYEEALLSYERALEFKANNRAIWFNYAYALSELGRYEEAIIHYDLALEIQREDHNAWKERGNALDKLGRYQEAIDSYDYALRIKPDHPNYLLRRSNLLSKLDKFQEASTNYNRYLELEPDDDPQPIYCDEIIVDKLSKAGITK
jgi:serine/threonine protein kinase